MQPDSFQNAPNRPSSPNTLCGSFQGVHSTGTGTPAGASFHMKKLFHMGTAFSSLVMFDLLEQHGSSHGIVDGLTLFHRGIQEPDMKALRRSHMPPVRKAYRHITLFHSIHTHHIHTIYIRQFTISEIKIF